MAKKKRKKQKVTTEQYRKYRENYEARFPHKQRYCKLRYRSKKRNIEFLLGYEEFRDFCIKHEIDGKTGRTKECLSFDRKDPRIGYHIDNMQILTVGENSSKGSDIPDEELPDWYLQRPKDPCPF